MPAMNEYCAGCGLLIIEKNVVRNLDYVTFEANGVIRRACRLCAFAYKVGLKSKHFKVKMQ